MRAALVLIAMTSPAAAQPASQPDLYVPAGATPMSSLPPDTEHGPRWTGTIAFANRSDTERQVRVEAIVSPDPGTPVLIARVLPAGAATPVGVDPVTLAARAPLTLRIGFDLPRARDYALFVRLLDPAGRELATAGQKITRAADAFPSTGVIATSVPARLIDHSFETGTTLSLPLSGLADRALRFRVTDVQVTRVDGGGETLTGVTPEIGSDCGTAETGATVTLAAQQICRLTVKADGLGAGDYRVRFALRAIDGDPRLVEAPFKVRAPWWTMLIWLVIGFLPGMLLAWWRDREQPRTDEALRIARVQADLAALAASVPSLREHLARLERRGKDLRVELAEGGDLEPIAKSRIDLSTRVGLVHRVVDDHVLAKADGTIAIPADLLAKRDEALREIGGAADAGVAGAAVDAFTAAVAAFRRGAVRGVTESAILPLPSWSAVGAHEDVPTLMHQRGIYEWGARIIGFALFAVVVLLSVWWTDPDWGSFADKATAILIGAAAFGTVATAISGFRTTVAAGRGS